MVLRFDELSIHVNTTRSVMECRMLHAYFLKVWWLFEYFVLALRFTSLTSVLSVITCASHGVHPKDEMSDVSLLLHTVDDHDLARGKSGASQTWASRVLRVGEVF